MYFCRRDYPVYFNFPVGHVTHNLPLINGARVEFTVGEKEVEFYCPDNTTAIQTAEITKELYLSKRWANKSISRFEIWSLIAN